MKKSPAPDYVVLLIGYSRPDLFERRLEEISLHSPEHLIVSIDHHSPEKQSELSDLTTKLQPNAKLWLAKQRIGLAEHITSAITRALSEHEYVIVVEDDVSVNEVFFDNIISYLPTMKSHGIASIGGFSPLTAVKPIGSNYFIQTMYFSSWGWATSREAWSEYQLDIRNIRIDDSTFSGSNWNSLSRRQKKTWEGRFRKIQVEEPHTWDIQFQFYNFKTNKNNLLPVWPLVHNEGFDDSRGAHTVGKKPRWIGDSIHEYRSIEGKIDHKIAVFIYNYVVSLTIAGDRKNIIPRIIASIIRFLRKFLQHWMGRVK